MISDKHHHNHSVLLNKAADKCSVCNKARESCIDYYVLGLNFHDWFITEERCTRLMSHWNEHNEWLNKPDEDIHWWTELWHGERFRELSYFWDPDVSTLLPEVCPSCSSIIPASTISSGKALEQTSQVCVVRPTCISECHVVPRYMDGDPRNQAIVFHIDGWNPHSTSAKHSIAAITISSACMSKLDRSANKKARVFSFIPVHQLPRDKYDAFLEPLLKELEDLYINGMEVFFRSPVPGYSEGNNSVATLRVLPLLLPTPKHMLKLDSLQLEAERAVGAVLLESMWQAETIITMETLLLDISTDLLHDHWRQIGNMGKMLTKQLQQPSARHWYGRQE